MSNGPSVVTLEDKLSEPATCLSFRPGAGAKSQCPSRRSQEMPLHDHPPGAGQISNGSQKTASEGSATGIMESSPSLSSSLASSSSESSIAGPGSNPDVQQRSVIFHNTIRKRPRISDLQQHVSTSNTTNEEDPARAACSNSKRANKRRCISTNAALQARRKFESPDRHIPQRPQLASTPSFRTSKSPSSLRGRELYTRSRNPATNPFRSMSESRSAGMAGRRVGGNGYGLRPPRYTPSFVHSSDAGSVSAGARRGTAGVRHPSAGGFWTVGGRAGAQFGQIHAVPAGDGSLLASGTNATIHTPNFLDVPTEVDQVGAHEARLAFALEIDQAARVLTQPRSCESHHSPVLERYRSFMWQDGAWIRRSIPKAPIRKTLSTTPREKTIPSVPFRILDAPHLKDDFYCSILAYSYASRTLAVALTHKVYLWTEEYGVRYPPLQAARAANFVTALAFSSDEGGKSILAVARHNGNVTLWSLLEPRPRFEAPHCCPASSLAFRPVVTERYSVDAQRAVKCEDLLVGDDNGNIYYYSLEWLDDGPGSMALLTKLDAHSQNICGLAWAPNGEKFVTGGNDNVALLFQLDDVFGNHADQETGHTQSNAHAVANPSYSSPVSRSAHLFGYLTPPATPGRPYIRGVHPMLGLFELPVSAVGWHSLPATLPATPPQPERSRRRDDPSSAPPGFVRPVPQRSGSGSRARLVNQLASPGVMGQANKHTFAFYHAAAVKAIAFAPWQPNLLATGGGSNDRQIHFHHTSSGATLAIINVFAQVTSLIWSTTRREIAATFGYSQPEHHIRIAVFHWPSCECVVSIPWERKSNGEIGRALWAIPYPGGPNDTTPAGRQSGNGEGFAAWEAVRVRENRRRRGEATDTRTTNVGREAEQQDNVLDEPARGRALHRAPAGQRRDRHRGGSRPRSMLRAEGEPWATRTEEEGSLIIACCDQTVKFFEVWAGKSKGSAKGRGLGSQPGVLGGSRILEGWCEEAGWAGSVCELSVGEAEEIR